MANENRISVIITADATGAITGLRLAGEETEKFGTRTQSTVQKLKSHWLEFTAGVTGAYLALQKMWGWMDQAAQLEERMGNLDRLTRQYGMSAEDLTGAIQRNSRGLIGLKDAADVATDALAKGFTAEQVARMASWAETAADTAAETMTVGEAFRSMEQSITAARERGVVKMFGATIDLEAALGKTAATMSKAQKAQAIFNLVAQEAEKRQRVLGEQTDSAADRMERFTNSVNQAKYFMGQLLLLVGQPFMAVFNVAITLAYGLAGAIGTVIATLARLTDELGITKDKAAELNRWAEKMYSNAGAQGEQVLQNMKGALDQLRNLGALREGGGGGVLGAGGMGENKKQIDELAALHRKYLEERDAANASELDRELVRAENWYKEQAAKLKELGATQREYTALTDAYTAKYQAAALARSQKVAEGEVKSWEKKSQDLIALDRARAEASLSEQERAVRQRMELEEAAAKVWAVSDSEAIRRKRSGERELLEIQSQRVLLKYDEGMSEAQLLVILDEYAQIQKQIAESKRMEVDELDLRRLALQREITELTRQQDESLRQSQLRTAQEALGNIGGGEVGGYLQTFSDIDAGKDRYTQEYEAWAALQDQKLLYLEETGATEAQIREAWRQYDVQQEATAQQQKLAMASAGFGMMANMASAFYSASGEKNKAAFAAMKLFRIAETVTNTYSAAVGAYNAMASIPYVGPILGAAAAAEAIAFGMAQVRAIAAMKPGGTGSSVSVPAAGGVGAGSGIPGSVELPAPKEAATAAPVINVHVYGPYVGDEDRFARELTPALRKAWGDNA